MDKLLLLVGVPENYRLGGPAFERLFHAHARVQVRIVHDLAAFHAQAPEADAVIGAKPLPRTDVTKKVWDYIKKNKLQDAKERRNINADGALKAVFGGKGQVSMFDMAKLISKQLK